MKTRTIFLPLGRVAPGTALAAAVLDRDHHTLLATGTVLDESTIDRLSRRGIESVAALLPDTRDAETIAQDLRDAEARVANIFRGAGSPAREALHAAVLQFRRESSQ